MKRSRSNKDPIDLVNEEEEEEDYYEARKKLPPGPQRSRFLMQSVIERWEKQASSRMQKLSWSNKCVCDDRSDNSSEDDNSSSRDFCPNCCNRDQFENDPFVVADEDYTERANVDELRQELEAIDRSGVAFPTQQPDQACIVLSDDDDEEKEDDDEHESIDCDQSDDGESQSGDQTDDGESQSDDQSNSLSVARINYRLDGMRARAARKERAQSGVEPLLRVGIDRRWPVLSNRSSSSSVRQVQQTEKSLIEQMIELEGNGDKANTNDPVCVQCMENKCSIIFKPCNHVLMCVECIRTQALYSKEHNKNHFNCPKCRTNVTAAEKIYF